MQEHASSGYGVETNRDLDGGHGNAGCGDNGNDGNSSGDSDSETESDEGIPQGTPVTQLLEHQGNTRRKMDKSSQT